MDNDRALPPSGSPANPAAVPVALQNLFSQPAEILIVLALHGVATCTQTERKDLLASAAAMQRPLYRAL